MAEAQRSGTISEAGTGRDHVVEVLERHTGCNYNKQSTRYQCAIEDVAVGIEAREH